MERGPQRSHLFLATGRPRVDSGGHLAGGGGEDPVVAGRRDDPPRRPSHRPGRHRRLRRPRDVSDHRPQGAAAGPRFVAATIRAAAGAAQRRGAVRRRPQTHPAAFAATHRRGDLARRRGGARFSPDRPFAMARRVGDDRPGVGPGRGGGRIDRRGVADDGRGPSGGGCRRGHPRRRFDGRPVVFQPRDRRPANRVDDDPGDQWRRSRDRRHADRLGSGRPRVDPDRRGRPRAAGCRRGGRRSPRVGSSVASLDAEPIGTTSGTISVVGRTSGAGPSPRPDPRCGASVGRFGIGRPPVDATAVGASPVETRNGVRVVGGVVAAGDDPSRVRRRVGRRRTPDRIDRSNRPRA